MAGAVSSLGVGSSILTQSVLDQLRKADEASRITPLDLKIADMKDRTTAIGKIDGWMSDLSSAASAMASKTLYTERSAAVTGTAVSVTADANTDIQSFSLQVISLATKEVNESGLYTTKTDPIATAAGTMNLNIGGTDFTINYDGTTTLDDLKNEINKVAGTKVNATVIQLATGDYRLFMSAVDSGDAQTMTLSDTSGFMSGTQLASGVGGMTTIQEGANASFKFNNQLISRASNKISDLVSGLTITLEKAGETSTVEVTQNRDNIVSKLEDFVTKYNTAYSEIAKMTHSSQDSKTMGIFSSDSTIKGMQREIQDMLTTLGGTHSLFSYGFDLDKTGKLSFDKTVFTTKMDESSSNVEAVFAGGTFTNTDTTTETLTGFFTDYKTGMDSYTKTSGYLDMFSTNMGDQLSILEEQKTKATERLDSKYELMSKQFAAYDSIISKINQQSSFLTQMISSANSTGN
ncbi:MAG: flagellar filament capping protein FliD [Sulfuricurvum sp.]|nr:flagellar filament capping protein FliD [Sulfuricurvum sp.]